MNDNESSRSVKGNRAAASARGQRNDRGVHGVPTLSVKTVKTEASAQGPTAAETAAFTVRSFTRELDGQCPADHAATSDRADETMGDDGTGLNGVTTADPPTERAGHPNDPAAKPRHHPWHVHTDGRGEGCRTLRPGTWVGHYRIVRTLGEGGMGMVFEAEQQNPRRRVALKVVAAGLATRRMLRRFELEAQMLGKLQHPHIAQIFEAGTFDAGFGAQPFFAMEFVEGRPLNRYAQEEGLDTPGRLRLMVRICHAVQHAHNKGVIHRDLKPANILVDNAGNPKILDFGVARAVEGDTEDAEQVSLHTGAGQLVGTVPYMSPEQAAGQPDELDTRSDVYGLGVVCYELLTGQLPYDLHRTAIHEAVRIIRETEPTALGRMDRRLRGDVETIVNRALAKDKSHRYPSPSEMAADIQRYLTFQPIVARPPTAWYQVRKFARRHRALVGAAATVFLFTLMASVISTTLYVQAEQARRAEREARRAAQTEAAIAQEVNRFLNEDLLASADPAQAAGEELTVAEVLNRAAATVSPRFTDQPRVEAAVRTTLGNGLRVLGRLDEARPHMARAHELRRLYDGPSHPRTLAAANLLASLDWAQGHYEQAESRWRRTITAYRRTHGQDHPLTIATQLNLALLLRDTGRLAAAEQRFAELHERAHRVLGAQHETTLTIQKHRAWMARSRGENDRAAALYQKVYDVTAEKHGPDHPSVLNLRAQRAELAIRQGRTRHGASELQAVYARQAEVLGREHPDTLGTLGTFGATLRAVGQYDQAGPILDTVLAAKERVLGASHPDTLASACERAALDFDLGRYPQARQRYGEALRALRDAVGEDHPTTIIARMGLAAVHRHAGRVREAEPLLVEALAAQKARFGLHHPRTLELANNLASVYWSLGRPGEALPHAERAVALAQQLNTTPGARIQAQNNLALVQHALGRHREAERQWRAARRHAIRAFGREHEMAALLTNNLSWALRELGEYAQAESLARHALNVTASSLAAEHPRYLSFRDNLGVILILRGRLSEARRIHQACLEVRRRTLGTDHPDTLHSLHNLAWAHLRAGEPTEALSLAQTTLAARIAKLGEHHPRTIGTRRLLARIHLRRNRPDQAREQIAAAEDRWDDALPADHPDRARLRILHGRALLADSGESAAGQARQVLRRAHSELASALGAAHPDAQQAIRLLVIACERLGDSGQADQWRARLTKEDPPTEKPEAI